MPRKRVITKKGKKKPSLRAGKKVVKRRSPKKKPVLVKPVWNVRVQRYNPHLDALPRTHEYQMTPALGENILDLLTRVKHEEDSSLTFQGSCGNGSCGGCGVKVNGVPMLGCVTRVADVVDKHSSLRVDPLYDTVLKDLVVDETRFFDELTKATPWLIPRKKDERREHKMGKKDVEKLANTPHCNLCGLCHANTGWEHSSNIGPATFVKAFRYVHDIRDGDASRTLKMGTIMPTEKANTTPDACPKNIFPNKKMIQLETSFFASQHAREQKARRGKR